MRVLTALVFVAFIGCCLAAFPSNTNALIGHLNQCVTKVQSDIQCINRVKAELERMSEYIQKLHTLRVNMEKIDNGFKTLATIGKFLKYAPPLQTAVNLLNTAVTVVRRTLNPAVVKVKAADDKLYKQYKPRIDRGIAACDNIIAKLQLVSGKCEQGSQIVTAARNCVNDMPSGNARRGAESAMETLGGAIAPRFGQLVQTLGNVGSTCNAIDRALNINLPDLGSIISGIGGFYNALKPILDFFAKLQGVLDHKFCMPDPVEPAREAGERTREAGEKTREAALVAAERTREATARAARIARERSREAAARAARFARERKEEIEERRESIFGGWGKRKRRELTMITKEEANHVLALQKRGDVCFSTQQLLDGVNKLFDPILKLAQKAIDAVLSALPSFQLPGIPNFTNLLNLNINFNLPSINFGDINFYNPFTNFNFQCGVEVQKVCSGQANAVNFNCGIGV